MEHRPWPEFGILLQHALEGSQKVSVRKRHTLGSACRSRRIEQNCQIGSRTVHRSFDWRKLSHQLRNIHTAWKLSLTEYQQVLYVSGRSGGFGQASSEAWDRQDNRRARIPKDLRHF